MNVGFVSLGCSKNLVDTEMCIGLFKKEKFNIVVDAKDADIIVVNTCGFIEPAKQEAINTILEMAELKKSGRCKYLIAMGCLVQRYKADLEKSLPEVDLFLSIDDYNNIWFKICELIGKKIESSSQNTLEYTDRIISTGNKTAYLKIIKCYIIIKIIVEIFFAKFEIPLFFIFFFHSKYNILLLLFHFFLFQQK